MNDDQLLGGNEGSADRNADTADEKARRMQAEREDTTFTDETSTETKDGAIPSGYGTPGGLKQ